MKPRHPVWEDPAIEARRPAVLSLLGENVGAAGRGSDEPGVIGIDTHAKGVPGDPVGRFVLKNGGADSDAKGAPGKGASLDEINRRPTVDLHVLRVRVPGRPQNGTNEPAPNSLGSGGSLDLVTDVYRRSDGVIALRPFDCIRHRSHSLLRLEKGIETP